jgi:peptide/nickel transport system substrate-binding protein
MHRTLSSRRGFLKIVGLGAAMPLLAACQATPGTPAPTRPPAAPATQPTTAPVGAPTTAAPAPTTVAAAPTTPPAASPKPGGTLKAMQAGDLSSVDGHYYTPGSGLSAWIVFDTLTEYDDNLKPQPALAESWDQSSDSKQISLTLRKGVTFHSGREVTSDDIIYNLNRILDFKLTAGIITGFVPPNTQWAARDKYTVTITTEKPWINVFDFLQVLNILDQNSPEGPRGKTTAVGTGAFSMVEWVQGDHVTYAKNKDYWRTGKPLLDQIVLNIAKDQQAMPVQLEAGQVDFIVNPTIQDFVRLSDDPTKYQGLELPNPAAFAMMQPNSTLPPMDNKLVRQALNWAIDRQRMADTVQLGRVKIQDLPWPPASPASEPQKNNLITFNLDKAKSLLQQAGVSNFDLDLLYSAVSATAAQQAQIYQSDLAKIGVNGIIRTLQPAALLDAWHTQTYGLYFAGDPWANLEPLTQFTSGSTTNYRGNNGGYLSDGYTKLVEAAAGEVDPAKRKQIYSQLNDFLLDEAFVYPLWSNITRAVAKSNLKDLGHRRNEMWTFYNAWLA